MILATTSQYIQVRTNMNTDIKFSEETPLSYSGNRILPNNKRNKFET